MHKQYWPLLAALCLAACNGGHDTQQTMKPQDTVFGDLVKAEDKARSVEATTMQRKNDLDSAIQANESDASRDP